MNRARLQQAAQEFAWTFGALFVVAFLGWATGWTKLPNLSEWKAFLNASGAAAIGGAAKAILWYFTGTERR